MARPALAATRAVALLNFLAAHGSEEFTLSDLAARLDINLASTHALLKALSDAGYVVRHPRLRSYALGPSVVALGGAALERHPAIRHARDEARRLSDSTGLGVAVTARAGDDMVFLERVGEHRAREISAYVGKRIPLTPPFGAVFVAWHDPEPWLARASDRQSMRAVLEEVRSRGWAVALETDAQRSLDHLPFTPRNGSSSGSPGELEDELRQGEYRAVASLDAGQTYDVIMVAAPVFDPGGDAVVALTLLGFEPALSAERIAAYGDQVRDAGLVATKRSGGRPPTTERRK
jgi:DNA-binding IclR family transcriptional regulator